MSTLLISIGFGSTIAFDQITALGVVALLASYMISIGSMALRRIRSQPLLPSHFSLGKWGLAINIGALLFLMLAFVMVFFPPVRNPELDSMNWSILIFGGVIIFSLAYYLRAKHKYVGPVKLVSKEL